jgi:hypothetical protein
LTGKFIEQLAEGHVLVRTLARCTVEGFEGACVAEREDVLCARHPVHPVRINEVSEDGKNGPGVLALVMLDPDIGQSAQQRIESRRRAGEKVERVVKIVLHDSSSKTATA